MLPEGLESFERAGEEILRLGVAMVSSFLRRLGAFSTVYSALRFGTEGWSAGIGRSNRC